MRNDQNEYDTTYPFFIAVTNTNNKILAKEVFYAPIHFEADKNTKKHVEILRQVIPTSQKPVSHFKIMAGFQLNESQLSYNRYLIEQHNREQQKAESTTTEQPKENKNVENNDKNEKHVENNNTPTSLIVPRAVRMGPFDVFKDE